MKSVLASFKGCAVGVVVEPRLVASVCCAKIVGYARLQILFCLTEQGQINVNPTTFSVSVESVLQVSPGIF